MVKFKNLGVCYQLCKVCETIGYKQATRIQTLVIPYALKGFDILGYAQTGSGKTLAFLIPIIQNILINRNIHAALIISPSRELAFQIASQGELLGGIFGIKLAVLTGGIDLSMQTTLLKGKPNIIISTPGRLVEHLGLSFQIKTVENFCFVIDEADKILQIDFEKELNFILSKIPKNKKNFLFSATKSLRENKIKNNWFQNPIRISLNSKYRLAKNLAQNYCFIPYKYKESYLIYLCNEFSKISILTFVETQKCSERLALLLKFLGFSVSCIHGGLSQLRRLKILESFKTKKNRILIATDLASRGLDIPDTDLVINFDIPSYAKTYIHRVGRTARAGKSGRTISLVTQYDVNSFQKIEKIIGRVFRKFTHNLNSVLNIYQIIKNEKEKCLEIFKK